jgi:hypothetical protein
MQLFSMSTMLLLVSFCTSIGSAAQPAPPPRPEPPLPTVTDVYGSRATDKEIEVGDRITFVLTNVDDYLAVKNADGTERRISSFRPIVAGAELSECAPCEVVSVTESGKPKRTYVSYRLTNTVKNRPILLEWLIRPGGPAPISIGPTGGPSFGPAVPFTLTLIAAGRSQWTIVAIGLGILLAAFLYALFKTDMFRDPPDAARGRRPFSLSRCQAGIWFVTIFGVFVTLAITWKSVDVLSSTGVILLGISGGAALGAVLIEGKRAPAVVPQPAEKVAEQTKQLTNDLLTNDYGAALHRLQLLLWTLVLAAFFIYETWRTLTMPIFSDTVLAMMGISAGTYLGFKTRE